MEKGPLADSEVVSVSRKYVPVKIDLTSSEGATLGEEFGVVGTPTFVLLNSEGESVASLEGYLESSAMIAFLREGLSRSH